MDSKIDPTKAPTSGIFDLDFDLAVLFSILRFVGPKMAARGALGSSWGGLGSLLGALGPSWDGLGGLLGRLEKVLGSSWGLLGPLGTVLAAHEAINGSFWVFWNSIR